MQIDVVALETLYPVPRYANAFMENALILRDLMMNHNLTIPHDASILLDTYIMTFILCSIYL